ncbi:MAG: hypothetical protein A2014_02830 [Spirochaetes bacterium GWF1_49_6]|nr:MAG: hypothetical protein A2014_02830 [Spirochaetes bacterium GWF1_49_6]
MVGSIGSPVNPAQMIAKSVQNMDELSQKIINAIQGMSTKFVKVSAELQAGAMMDETTGKAVDMFV